MFTFRHILPALFSLSLLSACVLNTGGQATATAAEAAATAAPAATAAEPITLSVMAAASLSDAFREIGQLYEQQHPENRVEFIFAGSQQLAQQLEQQAPADVFASANTEQVDALVKSGRVNAKAAVIFAQNRLVIITTRQISARIKDFGALRIPGLKIVLAANEVPAGRYSLEALEKASNSSGYGPSFEQEVLNNVVSYENNVRIVLTKVILGEADAGIVYTSDVYGNSGKDISQVPIPAEFNPTAQYPITVIKDSLHPLEAHGFLETVLSPAGQQILANHGFEPTSQSGP